MPNWGQTHQARSHTSALRAQWFTQRSRRCAGCSYKGKDCPSPQGEFRSLGGNIALTYLARTAPSRFTPSNGVTDNLGNAVF